MRIQKISENLLKDISSEKIEDVLENIKNIVEGMDEKQQQLKKIVSDLEPFSNPKKKINDQIDDSVLNLKKLDSDFIDILSILDAVSSNLEDYKENGRKYLY